MNLPTATEVKKILNESGYNKNTKMPPKLVGALRFGNRDYLLRKSLELILESLENKKAKGNLVLSISLLATVRYFDNEHSSNKREKSRKKNTEKDN